MFGQLLTPQEKAEKKAIVFSNAEGAIEAAMSLNDNYHREGKMDSAIIYGRELIKVGLEKNDSKIWLSGYGGLALAYMDTPNIDSAKYYLNLILDKTEFSNEEHMINYRAKTFMFFGAMYESNNLGYEEAFSYFRKAIESSKNLKDPFVYIRSSLALINNMMARNRHDEVRVLLSDAYEYLEKNNIKSGFALRLLDKDKALFLAKVSTNVEERKEALNLMLKVYNETDSLNLDRERVTVFIDIANFFFEEMAIEELIKMADLNFNATKDILDLSTKGGLYQAYGNVFMRSKQYNKAISIFKEAKVFLSETRNMENYLTVCEQLMNAYEETNQFDKISSEFQDYKTFRDSHEATVYSEQLLELEEKYKTEKKENENKQLLAQNYMIQTRFLFSSIIGFLLLGLLATGIYFFQRLKKTKKQLESTNEEKNKLFAILAHDLRNPIASLSNLSEKIKFLTKNNRLDELDEMVKNTDAKLGALNDNLNNILLWAITESNLVEIKLEQVSLRTEINKINELYTDDISQKNIVITNKIPESNYVQGDLTVIQTIMRNLISNAIKFSHQGGSIEYLMRDEKKWIELRVIDNGIGLEESESEQEAIHNISFRRKTKGTGIGLKICKELAVKSNLVLSLIPNPNGGTIGIIRFRKAG